MPKYTPDKVAGYWIYYKSECLTEGIIHIHANEPKTVRKDSAKVWVHEDGTSTVKDYGKVSKTDMKIIQDWIYTNYALIRDK